MVRPFREEVVRYGEYSKAGEFVYDHPFQFGSKRTGPDLHRVGGKYPHFWHFRHMAEPTSTTTGSLMPKYPWFYKNDLDVSLTQKKLSVMKTLGVPYSDTEVANAALDLQSQAQKITSELFAQGVDNDPTLEKKEIIALIAYLQRLGTDIKGAGAGS
jgi:cytochrome c oxidase cbb3-type subunit I/II